MGLANKKMSKVAASEVDASEVPAARVIASVTRGGKAIVRAAPDDSSDSGSERDGRGRKRGKRRLRVPRRRAVCSSLLRCLCCMASSRPSAVAPSYGVVSTAQYRKSQSISPEPSVCSPHVLPPRSAEDKRLGRKTLVLDLDETLVHSSFAPVLNADFVLPLEIQSVVHHVYVCKRPGVNKFLAAMGAKFEVVVFTASLQQYADPVVDLLDESKVVRARLFREHCVQHAGNFVKDLSVLGRDLASTVIVDNAPSSYVFQPENALPCASWFDDPADSQMTLLAEVLDKIADAADVREALEEALRDPKYDCLNNP